MLKLEKILLLLLDFQSCKTTCLTTASFGGLKLCIVIAKLWDYNLLEREFLNSVDKLS